MITALQHAIGLSTCNWLLIAGAGVLFFAAATLLPALLHRWRRKDGHPLL